MNWKKAFTFALGLMLAFVLAQAQTAVRLDLQAFRVLTVQTNGKTVEKFEMATNARPGQLIEYRLEAVNATDRQLKQVALVIPIPRTTAYQALSAAPLRLGETLIAPQFSFDGGNNYAFPPLKRMVRVQENGKEVEKEVEVKPEEYTNVRWVVPQLTAKENVQLKLRTVVR